METHEAIMKLYRIFKTNKWSEKDIDEYVFNNFCHLFTNLNEEQRALIIELTERYSWISFSDYQSKIINALNQIEQDKLNLLKTIYLFPIIKPEDEGKIKSGQSLIYLIKGLKQLLTNYSHIKFNILTKFKDLDKSHFNCSEDENLLLIDDYIGSGETINLCIAKIQENPSVSNGKINIVAIASQNEIFESIRNRGFGIYVDYIGRKGISDFNVPPILEEKIKTMLEIEKMIPGGSHFSLGYNSSEALITMMRTPDNTFPIFWKGYKKGRIKFDAPFSREEEIIE